MTARVLFLLIVAGTIYGCASLKGAVAPQVAKAVGQYCAEPYQERMLIRVQVNEMIAPAVIRVTCPDDPDANSSTP